MRRVCVSWQSPVWVADVERPCWVAPLGGPVGLSCRLSTPRASVAAGPRWRVCPLLAPVGHSDLAGLSGFSPLLSHFGVSPAGYLWLVCPRWCVPGGVSPVARSRVARSRVVCSRVVCPKWCVPSGVSPPRTSGVSPPRTPEWCFPSGVSRVVCPRQGHQVVCPRQGRPAKDTKWCVPAKDARRGRSPPRTLPPSSGYAGSGDAREETVAVSRDECAAG